MAHHNLHFTDREAARNWADNYGGRFHDNTHTRGAKGRETNYTVREEWDDDGCSCQDDAPIPETIFHDNSVVYHPFYGKGIVCGRHPNSNDWIQVRFVTKKTKNPNYDEAEAELKRKGFGYHMEEEFDYEYSILTFNLDGSMVNSYQILSFKPWDFVRGGFSQDINDRAISVNKNGCSSEYPKHITELSF